MKYTTHVISGLNAWVKKYHISLSEKLPKWPNCEMGGREQGKGSQAKTQTAGSTIVSTYIVYGTYLVHRL